MTIVSRKWEESLGCELSWPITMRMSSIPQPFCEVNSSSELARLVCPLKENHVKPIKRIYTVKGGDNTSSQFPLNFDEYSKQNSELMRRPSTFCTTEAVSLTTSHSFRSLFTIWTHVRANGPLLSYWSLHDSLNRGRGRLKMDPFLSVGHTDAPSIEKNEDDLHAAWE